MKTFLSRALPALAVATLLAACGGGDEGFIVEEKAPSPSGIAAAMSVTGASGPDVAFNGAYSTSDIYLNNVTKVNPIGGAPETCRFKFGNLPQTGNPSRGMTGDIRYVPGSLILNVAFVSIDGNEFSISGTTNTVSVDRPNNRVRFSAAQLTATSGSGRSIVLTGDIPMRGDRPEGC